MARPPEPSLQPAATIIPPAPMNEAERDALRDAQLEDPAGEGLRPAAALDDGELDEAELADVDPVGQREAQQRQRQAQAHAADPNMVEQHEAAALREAAAAQEQGESEARDDADREE